ETRLEEVIAHLLITRIGRLNALSGRPSIFKNSLVKTG
ncbi:MAG: hypothetical protein ACI85F_002433, partial [Bacteroidia bacterium]